jgi:hypothetical protein
MSNEISTAGQPSAFTEEDRLSAMIVERDVEIARLKGVIEHLQGVIGGLHMEAAQRDALTTKAVEGSIGDDPEFTGRVIAAASAVMGGDTSGEWQRFVAYIDSLLAARKAAVGVLTDKQKEAMRDALSATLGDAMDCTRHWSAWGYGTMSQDDFKLVADNDERIDDLVEVVASALTAQVSGQSGEKA